MNQASRSIKCSLVDYIKLLTNIFCEELKEENPLKKLLAIALTVLATVFTFGAPAFAGDAAAGAQIFSANCAACHAGGNNAVMPNKTLKEAALKNFLAGYKDGSKSLEDAVAYQVTNGQGAMPAFGGRLSDEAITDVAAYVADQAQNNKW